MRHRCAVVLVAVVGTVVATASDPIAAVGGRLRESIVAGRSFDYARELTERFGPRLTGSDAYERAAAWALGQFRAAGLRIAALEAFTIRHAWERGVVRATLLVAQPGPGGDAGDIGDRGTRTLHLEPLGWTPSTPKGGIEGDIAIVPDSSLSTSALSSVNGRVVLVDHATGGNGSSIATRGHHDFDAALAAAGALAVLLADPAPENVLTARPREYNTDISPLPVATIGRKDAELIRALSARSPVRVAFEYRNRISDNPVETHNVVAEISGRERPDEWVIVGAHLDSWDFATGAQDNATGAAMVIEAARAIAALDRPPRRSIRFALWGGEEQGMQGSNAYVRVHAQELDACVAVLNTDGGTGRVRGWLVPGRQDVAVSLRPVLQTLLAPLGAAALDTRMQYAFDSDHAPFLREGIPALDLDPDDSRYEEIHHKASDTIDNVDPHNLVAGASVVALTAYAIADAPQRLASRHRVRDPR